jgi:hypothetical protein
VNRLISAPNTAGSLAVLKSQADKKRALEASSRGLEMSHTSTEGKVFTMHGHAELVPFVLSSTPPQTMPIGEKEETGIVRSGQGP